MRSVLLRTILEIANSIWIVACINQIKKYRQITVYMPPFPPLRKWKRYMYILVDRETERSQSTIAMTFSWVSVMLCGIIYVK